MIVVPDAPSRPPRWVHVPHHVTGRGAATARTARDLMLVSAVTGAASTVTLLLTVLPTTEAKVVAWLVGVGGLPGFGLLLASAVVTTKAVSAFRPGFVELTGLGRVWTTLPILAVAALMLTSVSGAGLLFLTLVDLDATATVAYVVTCALTPMPVVLPVMTMIVLGVAGTARSFVHHPPATVADVFPSAPP